MKAAIALFSLLLGSHLSLSCKSDSKAKESTDLLTKSKTGKECSPLQQYEWMRVFRQTIEQGSLSLRVGIAEPTEGVPKADILYFHGFADRIDNHRPLFEQWTNGGYRVIAFDYPSHGETCGSANTINQYNFRDIAKFAQIIEAATRMDHQRPLFLAGWSTGGTIAARMVQSDKFAQLGRKISGMILFSPGIPVRPIVGQAGTVTSETLTRNLQPPHMGEIKPKSPLLTPIFASNILLNSNLAYQQSFPVSIPLLIFVGGDEEDRYVNSASLKKWAAKRYDAGGRVLSVSCEGGFHELDNEPDEMGQQVRRVAVDFVTGVLGDFGYVKVAPGPCQRI
jgi:alpha-beta hydrolase superfamily lysophospholipase